MIVLRFSSVLLGVGTHQLLWGANQNADFLMEQYLLTSNDLNKSLLCTMYCFLLRGGVLLKVSTPNEIGKMTK